MRIGEDVIVVEDYLPAATSIEKSAEKLRKLFILFSTVEKVFFFGIVAHIFNRTMKWSNKKELNEFTIRHTPTTHGFVI